MTNAVDEQKVTAASVGKADMLEISRIAAEACNEDLTAELRLEKLSVAVRAIAAHLAYQQSPNGVQSMRELMNFVK